jgi:ornithine carbamoyltransferase
MMHTYACEHFLSISDLEPAGLFQLLEQSERFTERALAPQVLAGRTIVLVFEKPSLRTRVTFEVAVRRLGGWPVLLNGESRLGERETVPDVARNLSLWVDGIVARVYSHDALSQLAAHSTVPVINALSDIEHPCQALADLMTLKNIWGRFDGRTVVYVGDWNNVARSLWKACIMANLHFRAVTPPQYAPVAGEAVDWSPELNAAWGADAIYTDVWVSMGQEDQFDEKQRVLAPYQVNDALLGMTGKATLFMHCLPAHRGLEVTESVIDSNRSLVFQQAANRLPAEMAILHFLFGASA